MVETSVKRSGLYDALVDYFFMAFLVISCNSIYTVIIPHASVTSISLVASMFFLTIAMYSIALHRNVKMVKSVNLIVIYFIWIFLGVGILNILNNVRYITVFMLVLPTCLAYCYGKYIDGYLLISLRRLVNTIVFTAVLSLIFWMLFSNLHLISGTSFYSPWSELIIKRYGWIHFDTQIEGFFGFGFMRNTGFFPEAPMFAYILLIGLYIELFLNERMNKKIIAILMLTLLTIFSTTGILLGIISGTVKLFIDNAKRLNKKSLCIMILLSMLVLVVARAILGQKSGSSSAQVRNDDIRAGLQAWKQNVVFGNGFSNPMAITDHMAPWRHMVGNSASLGYTSGLLTILSDGGLFLFIIYILPLIGFVKKNVILPYKEKIVALVFTLITLAVTITPYVPLTMFIVAVAYIYCFVADSNIEQKKSNS